MNTVNRIVLDPNLSSTRIGKDQARRILSEGPHTILKNDIMKKMLNKQFCFLLMILLVTFVNCNNNMKKDESIIIVEKFRPGYHFTPDSMWMNDPNGMVFLEEEYHLFYQFYPGDIVWGPMHWGHAVSKDLIRWEHLPIALYPDSLGYIFSGSAVYDEKNTSGLGSDGSGPLVAIFTYHDPVGEKEGRKDFQNQGIAFSNDKGRSWTKYTGNPVLKNPGTRDFRDPKVFWFEKTQSWKMIFAAGSIVKLYDSQDLKTWTFLSDFGENKGSHDGIWECPDLFQLNDPDGKEKWLMLVSIGRGGPNGGSATQYFIGDFDGTNFTTEQTEELWIDYGRDNYAGVTWSNTEKRKIFLGWMSNWTYAQSVPTIEWRSAMTIPRELRLMVENDSYVLVSDRVPELKNYFRETKSFENIFLNGRSKTIKLDKKFRSSLSFEMNFSSNNYERFSIVLNNNNGEKVDIILDLQESTATIDRSQSGLTDFEESFANLQNCPLPKDFILKDLELILDHSSIEVFINKGQRVMTSLVFPEKPYSKIEIKCEDGEMAIDNILLRSIESVLH